MIRRLCPIKFGRLTPVQTESFGQSLASMGSIGYIGVGPVLLIFNLPRPLVVTDPIPSIFDINAHLREVYASQGKPAPAWLPPPN